MGAAYFLQGQPQSDEPLSLLRPEWRAQQELNLRQSLGETVRLEHRYRIEQRLQQLVENNALTDGWDFSWRFRYRAQLVVPFMQKSWLSLSLKVYDEILINAGKPIRHNIFDQNRIGAAVSLKAAKNISAELGYMHWYQQRPAGDAFFKRHIVRFTLTHHLSLAPQS